MDTTSLQPTQTPDQSRPNQIVQETGKIVYREYIQGDGFVTGIAEYADPGGSGKFKLRVSGQRNTVDGYAQNARIVKMQLTPIPPKTSDVFGEHRQSALTSKKQWWYAQLDGLKKIVQNTNDPAKLNDPDWLWRQGPGAKNEALDRMINLKQPGDCLIEIEASPLTKPSGSNLMSLYIDPMHIPFRGLHVYKPLVAQGGSTSKVWAQTHPSGGNPDLYLWLYCLEDGGANPRFKDSSGHPANVDDQVSATDNVNECHQGGIWRVHVYGASDADYDINIDWRLEVALPPI
ncbi:MAG: hypothetical protein HZB51_19275 [Chloroflexi bacterium]|nr:hypothetical protein [Chloroflexota bacterium]